MGLVEVDMVGEEEVLEAELSLLMSVVEEVVGDLQEDINCKNTKKE